MNVTNFMAETHSFIFTVQITFMWIVELRLQPENFNQGG